MARIPAAVVSDERQHQGVLAGDPSAVRGPTVCGQAFTIESICDGAAPREALAETWPGACIVIDARASPDAAVWGGNLIRIARERGIAPSSSTATSAISSICAKRPRRMQPRHHAAGSALGRTYRRHDPCGGSDSARGSHHRRRRRRLAVPLDEVNDELLERCRARVAREAEGRMRMTETNATARGAATRSPSCCASSTSGSSRSARVRAFAGCTKASSTCSTTGTPRCCCACTRSMRSRSPTAGRR